MKSEGVFMRKSGPLITDKKTGEVFQPVAFMHYCAHPGCFEWGCYGYGSSLLKNIPGVYYCAQHRPPRRTDNA